MQTTSSLQFILNGQLTHLQHFDPSQTFLQYLRESKLLTGTKEGCAEGDCGACTVVVAIVKQGRIQFKSINACIQFLPMLHGKAIYTVEFLKTINRGELHPVQQAMVDFHASQCGFCTPGFVMSLFALFKNQAAPNREQINTALSGNLCRCTGYKPIINAALHMNDYASNNHWLAQAGLSSKCSTEEAMLVQQLDAIDDQESLTFACNNINFYLPNSEHALAELLQQHPKATLIAGNTDVGLWVNKQLRDLPYVISIMKIPSLQVVASSNKNLAIAAAVSLSEAFQVLEHYLPQLKSFFRRFASLPVRNAGTLVGNLANGSPIGDMPPLMLVLSAQLLIKSAKNERNIALNDFYLGYQQKDLASDEYVHSVVIPKPNESVIINTYKISKRQDQDISAVCAAFALELDEHQAIKSIKIGLGGMAAMPVRAVKTEAYLSSKLWNGGTIDQAMKVLAEEFTPLSDLRASSEYRKTVVSNLLKRFFLDSLDDLSEALA